ncbi:putative DD41D transposase [Trichonephila clavipes]|nr:putative DD41D transposase [Trichonephila clavipes]
MCKSKKKISVSVQANQLWLAFGSPYGEQASRLIHHSSSSVSEVILAAAASILCRKSGRSAGSGSTYTDKNHMESDRGNVEAMRNKLYRDALCGKSSGRVQSVIEMIRGYTPASSKTLWSSDPTPRAADCQVIYSQFGLAIHQNDHQARRRFVEWAQNEIVVVPDFHKRILFSDEAHFWLNGYVNKQNCRIWSEANLQVYVETPLHPEKLSVWCALWAGGIIGPYFFKNDEGHNVTVNGDGYRTMITNFFIPELNNHDVQELWFQPDGATCPTARATIDLLKDTFGDCLISRF